MVDDAGRPFAMHERPDDPMCQELPAKRSYEPVASKLPGLDLCIRPVSDLMALSQADRSVDGACFWFIAKNAAQFVNTDVSLFRPHKRFLLTKKNPAAPGVG